MALPTVTQTSFDRSEVWTYPFRVAVAASWRLVLSVAAISVLPTAALALLLLVSGLSLLAPFCLVAIAAGFAVSYFVHELAHAVSHWLMARRSGMSVEMIPDGSFTHARIIRWSLGRDGDAVTSMAGPLCGLLCGVPMLLVPAPFIAVFPLFGLFLIHVASLHPKQADGAQVLAALRVSAQKSVLLPDIGMESTGAER